MMCPVFLSVRLSVCLMSASSSQRNVIKFKFGISLNNSHGKYDLPNDINVKKSKVKVSRSRNFSAVAPKMHRN